MKVLYFDCFSGAAGDMILGALIDAGLPLSELKRALGSLGVEGWDISADPVVKVGITATKFRVHEPASARPDDGGELRRGPAGAASGGVGGPTEHAHSAPSTEHAHSARSSGLADSAPTTEPVPASARSNDAGELRRGPAEAASGGVGGHPALGSEHAHSAPSTEHAHSARSIGLADSAPSTEPVPASARPHVGELRRGPAEAASGGVGGHPALGSEHADSAPSTEHAHSARSSGLADSAPSTEPVPASARPHVGELRRGTAGAASGGVGGHPAVGSEHADSAVNTEHGHSAPSTPPASARSNNAGELRRGPAEAASGGEGGHSALHRHYHLAGIKKRIDQSALSETARARAKKLFDRLAEAEASVHGMPIEKVHLHEVGALDSIIDIVGTVFALEWFGADRIVVSPLNVGSGTVKTAHGVYPVPAPATLRLLGEAPVYGRDCGKELLTPTGALLLTDYATSFGPMPMMRVDRIGYGAGDSDLEGTPNVLRVVVGRAPPSLAHPSPELRGASPTSLDQASLEGRGASAPSLDQTSFELQGTSSPSLDQTSPELRLASAPTMRVVVMECEIDDMNPQIFGALMDRLHAAGALDVFYVSVQMKKNRPGTLMTIIARPADREALVDLVFRETTTIGVRYTEMARECLDRETVTVDTSLGPVRFKVARREGRVLNAQPEFDDLVRLAGEHFLPIKEVQALAAKAWLER